MSLNVLCKLEEITSPPFQAAGMRRLQEWREVFGVWQAGVWWGGIWG